MLNRFNEALHSMHLLDKINYKRVAYRLKQTVEKPHVPMKVVLFEYDYTKLADVNKGVIPGRLETIPGTTVHVHYVVHTDTFKELMQSLFSGSPEFTWFHRKRWDNPTRRQVVLMFTPQPAPLPSPVLAAAQEDEYVGMPELVNVDTYDYDYDDMPPLIPVPTQPVHPDMLANETVYNTNAWAWDPKNPSLGLCQQ